MTNSCFIAFVYAKQLRVPTFNQYEEAIRQLEGNKSFDDFLVSLMQAGLENRQEGNRRRKIHSARFPYTKTLEEFDCAYLQNVSEAQIHQLASCDLLIIDEMSYLTFNRHQWELLFKVIADCSERKSIIVSTNLTFSDWLTMFENQTMVAAMIDRLTYRSHVLDMNGDSYRLKATMKGKP